MRLCKVTPAIRGARSVPVRLQERPVFNLRSGAGLSLLSWTLSHRIYSLISFRKTTSSQNRCLNPCSVPVCLQKRPIFNLGGKPGSIIRKHDHFTRGGRLVYQFVNTTTSRQRGRWDETSGLRQPITTPKGGFILLCFRVQGLAFCPGSAPPTHRNSCCQS
jgi:hypothetical protein